MSVEHSTITAINNKSRGEKPKKFKDGSVSDLHQDLIPHRATPGPLNLVEINMKEEYKTLGGTIGFSRRGGTVSTPSLDTSKTKGGTIQATNYGVFNPMLLGGKQIKKNDGNYLKY